MIKINTKILAENKVLFQNLMIWIMFILPFFADAQQRPSESRFQGCKNGIVVDVRYRQGLTQLNQRLYDIPGMGGKLYSSSLIFNMGITL